MIKEHLSKQENKTFYLTVYPLIQDFKYLDIGTWEPMRAFACVLQMFSLFPKYTDLGRAKQHAHIHWFPGRTVPEPNLSTLEKEMVTTPVFLSRKSHGQRILAGYSPWGRKEMDMTEQLNHGPPMQLVIKRRKYASELGKGGYKRKKQIVEGRAKTEQELIIIQLEK